MTTDLFGILSDPDGRALSEAERKRMLRRARERNKRGHAWQPGTGPAGETCGTCGHLVRRMYSKAYLKCGLMRERWSSGPKTDIRARDAACKFWSKRITGEHRE